VIHKRTLKNWGSLSPYIWPYLFVNRNDSAVWTPLAKHERWQTIEVEQFRDNLPVFKEMFKTLEQNSDSTFIGFANDDILFDESLLQTLTYLKSAVKNIEHRDLMLVGRRRDYVMHVNESLNVREDLSSLSALYHQLQLAGPDAIDFIIFARSGFKWENIPDIVVGATGLINYILSMALEWNYIVIEVTSSVNIIHQTEPTDPHSWVKGGTYDNDTNIALFKSAHDNYENALQRGQTLCVAFITICRRWTGRQTNKNIGCNFALAKRKNLPDFCKVRARYGHKGLVPVHGHEHHRRREPDEYDTFEGLSQQL
jgi:hypothetical protein